MLQGKIPVVIGNSSPLLLIIFIFHAASNPAVFDNVIMMMVRIISPKKKRVSLNFLRLIMTSAGHIHGLLTACVRTFIAVHTSVKMT